MVALTPDQQAEFTRDYPDAFAPETGAWGRAGATKVRLASVREEMLGEAVTLAWQNIKNRGASPRKSRSRTAGPPRQSRKR